MRKHSTKNNPHPKSSDYIEAFIHFDMVDQMLRTNCYYCDEAEPLTEILALITQLIDIISKNASLKQIFEDMDLFPLLTELSNISKKQKESDLEFQKFMFDQKSAKTTANPDDDILIVFDTPEREFVKVEYHDAAMMDLTKEGTYYIERCATLSQIASTTEKLFAILPVLTEKIDNPDFRKANNILRALENILLKDSLKKAKYQKTDLF